MQIDRNDVDISKLFEWSEKCKLYDRVGNVVLEVYVRLVGDAELNRARVYALRKSKELRRKLREKESDERLAFIPEIDEVEKDGLIENLILHLARPITERAIDNLQFPFPKEPRSDAALELQENYQEKVDNYPEERKKLVSEAIQKELEVERNRLKKKTKEELYKDYVIELINYFCETEMVTKYREACAYYGTYLDAEFNERLYSSLEEFNNSPTELKNQLMEYYMNLEISGENLKKSQEVMQ